MAAPLNSYDYVVVGGGPVGAIMALGLAQQSHSVALVERSAPVAAVNALGVDPRTVALSLASQSLLDTYNAWPEAGVGAFAHMEVWEDRGTSVLRFGAEDVDQPTLGHIVEVSGWLTQLWALLEASSVNCIVGRSVESVVGPDAVDAPDQGYRLGFGAVDASGGSSNSAAPECLIARTLIAADGANSVVRRELGVSMPLVETGQSALAFAARVERSHEHTAFQRFLATGPLALLPMAQEQLVSVVWSALHARADELASLSIEQLGRALTTATEARLGRVEEVLAPQRFPLRQGVIDDFNPYPGVVFIGDAARVVHPLAGQGVNLGFEDVRALLECTQPAKGHEHQPAPAALRRFARVRRARSRLAVAAMTALSVGYAEQSPGVNLVRNTLTRALGQLDVVRRQLVLEAMGLGPVARAS